MKLTAQSLAGVEAFAHEGEVVRADIAQRLRPVAFMPGELVIKQDEPGSGVFFLISGRVRATYFSRAGREVAFRDLEAGDMLGELAAIDGGKRSAEVLALERVHAAHATAEVFFDLVRTRPHFAEHVLKRMALLVRLLSERVVELSTLGATNRIHAEVLRLAQGGLRVGSTVVISPAPTHFEIAARVSTQREAVTRELGVLKRSGIVKKEDGSLVVLDLEALVGMVNRVSV